MPASAWSTSTLPWAESLTVLENIVLGSRSLGAPTLRLDEARAKLARLMGESGLKVELDQRISRLTVGERQRVEILKFSIAARG
jgi:simple sugar transport system ATP-binding protein